MIPSSHTHKVGIRINCSTHTHTQIHFIRSSSHLIVSLTLLTQLTLPTYLYRSLSHTSLDHHSASPAIITHHISIIRHHISIITHHIGSSSAYTYLDHKNLTPHWHPHTHYWIIISPHLIETITHIIGSPSHTSLIHHQAPHHTSHWIIRHLIGTSYISLDHHTSHWIIIRHIGSQKKPGGLFLDTYVRSWKR